MIFQSTNNEEVFRNLSLKIGKDAKSSMSTLLRSRQARKIQTIFETVQAQLNNLTFCDAHGFGPELCASRSKIISPLSEPDGKLTKTTVCAILSFGGEDGSMDKSSRTFRLTNCSRSYIHTATKIHRQIKEMMTEPCPSQTGFQLYTFVALHFSHTDSHQYLSSNITSMQAHTCFLSSSHPCIHVSD